MNITIQSAQQCLSAQINTIIDESINKSIASYINAQIQPYIIDQETDIQNNGESVEIILKTLNQYAVKQQDLQNQIKALKLQLKKSEVQVTQHRLQNQKIETNYNKLLMNKDQIISVLQKKNQTISNKLIQSQRSLQTAQFSNQTLKKQMNQIQQEIQLSLQELIAINIKTYGFHESYMKQAYNLSHSSEYQQKMRSIEEHERAISEFIKKLNEKEVFVTQKDDKTFDYIQKQQQEIIEPASLSLGKQSNKFMEILLLLQETINKNRRMEKDRSQERAKYQQILDQVKAKMHTFKQKNRSMNQKLLKLKNQKQALNSHLVQSTQHSKQIKSQLDQIKQHKSRLDQQLKEAKKMIQNKQIEIDSLKDSLNTLKSAFEEVASRRKCSTTKKKNINYPQKMNTNTSSFEEIEQNNEQNIQILTNSNTKDRQKMNQNMDNQHTEQIGQLQFDSCVMQHMIDKNCQIQIQNNQLKKQIEYLLLKQQQMIIQKHQIMQNYYKKQTDIEILSGILSSNKQELQLYNDKYLILERQYIKQQKVNEILRQNQLNIYETLATQKNAMQSLQIQLKLSQKRSSVGQIINRTNSASNKQNLQNNCNKQESEKDNKKSYYEQSLSNLNNIINYMINYLKGFTRNGIRQKCWATAQGQKYLATIRSKNYIKHKFVNFQKIRQLCKNQKSFKQVIRDFQIIANYYFNCLDTSINNNVIEDMQETRCKSIKTMQNTLKINSQQITPKKIRQVEQYWSRTQTNTNMNQNKRCPLIGSIGKNYVQKQSKANLNSTKKMI